MIDALTKGDEVVIAGGMLGKEAPLGPGWPGIVATASDEPQRVPHGPALDLHDIPAIAQLVMDRAQPCSLGPAGRAERSADWP